MSARKHDYRALEREYVQTPGLSIRALCRRHGIKSYSSVAAYARAPENDWEGKRARVIAKAEDKAVELVSDRLADEQAELVSTVRSEWLTVIRAATYKFAEDLKDPQYKVSVDSLIKLIDKGLVLLGEPSSRTEERHLALTGSLDGVNPDILRRIAAATRPERVVGRGEGLPPRTHPEDTRPN